MCSALFINEIQCIQTCIHARYVLFNFHTENINKCTSKCMYIIIKTSLPILFPLYVSAILSKIESLECLKAFDKNSWFKIWIWKNRQLEILKFASVSLLICTKVEINYIKYEILFNILLDQHSNWKLREKWWNQCFCCNMSLVGHKEKIFYGDISLHCTLRTKSHEHRIWAFWTFV